MGWISQILTGLTFIAKTAVVARSRRMVVTVDSHSGCPVHTDSVTAHQYPLHLYHLQYHQEIREESVYYFIYLRLLAYAVCVFRHEWWH
jgi:hypothetical protein